MLNLRTCKARFSSTNILKLAKNFKRKFNRIPFHKRTQKLGLGFLIFCMRIVLSVITQENTHTNYSKHICL